MKNPVQINKIKEDSGFKYPIEVCKKEKDKDKDINHCILYYNPCIY